VEKIVVKQRDKRSKNPKKKSPFRKNRKVRINGGRFDGAIATIMFAGNSEATVRIPGREKPESFSLDQLHLAS